jgi:predicted NUDIX family NTP pyrophosphohydrolase
MALEVLLVHPGGPFWRNKDDGAWSIPKGELEAEEDHEKAARREFAEELGPAASIGPLRPLGEIRQRGGKRVVAFCGEGGFDPAKLFNNSFESGRCEPAACRHFRKSAARSGSISTPRRRRYCLAKSNSSTGWPGSVFDGWID